MSDYMFIGFHKPLKKIRRRYRNPPPNREQVELAVIEYLKSGGKITRLDDAPEPGRLSQISMAEEFTADVSSNMNL